jgi:ADP-ribose pyrophosphatase
MNRVPAYLVGAVSGAVATYIVHRAFERKKDTERYQNYLHLLQSHPNVMGPIGNAANGEIEIVRDPKKMREIERATGQKVGVVAMNRFSTCIYDPVKFPNGTYGIHGRFFGTPTFEGPPGAAILPILPDGKVLLISIYRHPLRQWVLELPRGVRDSSESILTLIRRELKEETGAEVAFEEPLGAIDPDSGMTVGDIPIVKVHISKIAEANRDNAGESSMRIHAFTLEELHDAIRAGYATVNINGKPQRMKVTDSFLLSSLLLDQLKKKYKNPANQ